MPIDLGAPAGALDVLEMTEVVPDHGWSVVVHNDPVNLMQVVTAVFIAVLQIPQAKAEKYMWTVHTQGKCKVFTGNKDECSDIAAQLGTFNLWATVEKEGA